jgi:hypothetical protein
LVIVKRLAEGVVQIVRAEAVPEAEAWLHKNPEVLARVRSGMEQATRGELVDGPDLAAGDELVKKLEE